MALPCTFPGLDQSASMYLAHFQRPFNQSPFSLSIQFSCVSSSYTALSQLELFFIITYPLEQLQLSFYRFYVLQKTHFTTFTFNMCSIMLHNRIPNATAVHHSFNYKLNCTLTDHGRPMDLHFKNIFTQPRNYQRTLNLNILYSSSL